MEVVLEFIEIKNTNLATHLARKSFPIDRGALVAAGYDLARHANEEHSDVETILRLHGTVMEGFDSLDEEHQVFYNDFILTVRELATAGRGVLFREYMRGVLKDKRVGQSYRSVRESFPPGSVSMGDKVNLLFRVGSHLSLELNHSMIARETLRDLNATIHSILEGEELGLMQALAIPAKFLEG